MAKLVEVSYSNNVVRVTGDGNRLGGPTFDSLLSHAYHVLSHFRMSKPGSTWGCDGIGYDIQKKLGFVDVKKSGVGPRKAAEGIKAVAACERCNHAN